MRGLYRFSPVYEEVSVMRAVLSTQGYGCCQFSLGNNSFSPFSRLIGKSFNMHAGCFKCLPNVNADIGHGSLLKVRI